MLALSAEQLSGKDGLDDLSQVMRPIFTGMDLSTSKISDIGGWKIQEKFTKYLYTALVLQCGVLLERIQSSDLISLRKMV